MESKNDSDNTNEWIGNYLIQYPLGKGEFSNVYLAHDAKHNDRLVAIKLFASKAPLSQQEKRRFFRRFFEEAKILEQLNHEYILGFYEANRHNDTPYLVVEYAPNGSLRQCINQRKPTLLSLQEAITILEQIGAALHYAHHLQVIHRDLKPENILFNARNDALLADFGIASKQDITQSITKKPIAIRYYMSPEELQGKTFMESDQYALGIIAYELFTGHIPFTGYDAIEKEEPKPLREYNPQIPDYIESAVLQAIEKKRGNRHKNVSLFIARLRGTQEKTELYDVFLSYSEKDKDWAEDLAMRLKDKEGFKVWFKEWKMIPGRPEQKTIEEALEQSKCYAICIGAEAASKWVDMERQAALRRQHNDDSFRVIPIYLRDAKELDATEFLGSNTPVDYRSMDSDYAFYLLTCGIKGIEPGVWEPETPSTENKRSATEIELQELQRLMTKKLIEPGEASERRRQILQRPLASDSIKSRLKEIKQLCEEGLITDEVAKEKIRKITDEI